MFTFKLQYQDQSTEVVQGESYKYFPAKDESIDLHIFTDRQVTHLYTLRFCAPDVHSVGCPDWRGPYGAYVMNDQGRTVDRVGWPGRNLPPEATVGFVGECSPPAA